MLQVKLNPIKDITLMQTNTVQDVKTNLLSQIARQISAESDGQEVTFKRRLLRAAVHETVLVDRTVLIPVTLDAQRPAVTVVRLGHDVNWFDANNQQVNAVVVLRLDDNYGRLENQRIITGCAKILADTPSLDAFIAFEQNNPTWQVW